MMVKMKVKVLVKMVMVVMKSMANQVKNNLMQQFLLFFFLLILNVQISQFCFSSHCECANLQSPSFVRDPINSGSEASLGAKTSHT